MDETETLDLRGIPCPKNAAKASLVLAGMDSGEKLTVLIDNGEPLENVPPALEGEGHTIERTWPVSETATALLVIVG